MTRLFACKLVNDIDFQLLKPALLHSVPVTCAEKALGYYHAADAQRHLLGELLARYAIEQMTGLRPNGSFALGEKGKPHPEGINGIHFNVSHSGEWVVVAVSDHTVGVDVERIRKVPEGVAERFFSEPEKQWLFSSPDESEKAHRFFTLWTLKESFLKAIGKGLTKSLSSFTVITNTTEEYTLAPDEETTGFFLKSYTFVDGYKLAACAAGNDFAKETHTIEISQLLNNA